jgi:hypothetical protein
VLLVSRVGKDPPAGGPIPWSRYPDDLGYNFVVTHKRCNEQKSDHLAALPHLERWAERNDTHRYALSSVIEEVGTRHELETSRRAPHVH